MPCSGGAAVLSQDSSCVQVGESRTLPQFSGPLPFLRLNETAMGGPIRAICLMFVFGPGRLPMYSVSGRAQDLENGSRVGVDVPERGLLFRKAINLRMKAVGRIEIAADDEYEVFVNGKSIGRGNSARQMQEYNISDYLEIGRNVIAVRVVNTHGKTAAMAARVSIRPGGSGKWYTFSSSPSWRTSTEESPMWQRLSSMTVYGDLHLLRQAWRHGAKDGPDVVAEKQTE